MLLFILIFLKQLLTEQSIVSGKQGWLGPPEIGQTETKLNPLEKRFIHIKSRRKRFLPANPLCWTSRICLRFASIRRNRTRLRCTLGWSKYWHFVLLKRFYERHCAPCKWNIAMMHAALQDFVSNKIVIAFTTENRIKCALMSADCFL